MPVTRLTCPECGKHLKTSKPLQAGNRVHCSRCGHSFAVPADPAADAGKDLPRLPPVPDGQIASPVSNRQMLWIALTLGGLLLLLITTLSLALYFALHKGTPDTAVEPAVSAPSGDERRMATEPQEDVPSPPPPQSAARSVDSPLLPDPALVPTEAIVKTEQEPWLPAEEQEQVNKTIDRGMQWLKQHQGRNGSWGGRIGLAALPALTLLECGVSTDDNHIQNARRRVQMAIPNLRQTYDLSLAILFLDRLGDPADKKLIQTCALRLAAGQFPSGGWTYDCPLLTSRQEDDLLTVMRGRRPASSLDLFVGGPGGSAPPGFIGRDPNAPLDKDIQGKASGDSKLLPEGKPLPPEDKPLDKPRPRPRAVNQALKRLPSELQKLPSLLPPKQSHKLPSEDNTDNSNTQFAILGLLAAYRHDLPLERAFALIVQRFHVSQEDDGRWNYKFSSPPHPESPRPAMTGAGLLGLAVQYGLAADHAQPRAKQARIDDPAVTKGFANLAQVIGKPIGWKKPRAKNRETINLYLLWTIERCGVLYHQRKIEGKDWYQWGVELLLDHQRDDGSWNTGGYYTNPNITPITDTCFALLFLKRANLAKELTKKLEFFMEGKALQSSP
jgi:hypothetical protein